MWDDFFWMKVVSNSLNKNQIKHSVQQIHDDHDDNKSLFFYRSEKDLAYKMVKINDGNRGRPVYDITKDQLEYLVDLSFTGTEMAKLLQVSHSTIKRRLRSVNFNKILSLS